MRPLTVIVFEELAGEQVQVLLKAMNLSEYCC